MLKGRKTLVQAASRERRSLAIIGIFGAGVALVDLAITQASGEVWSYLLPICPILVFTIGLGLKKRRYGYLFAICYAVTCFAWMLAGIIAGGRTGEIAAFVGGAGLAMTVSIFALVWIIFWHLWRSVSSVKDNRGEIQPENKD